MLEEDQRGPAIREWEASEAPHRYWYGVDERGGRWLFESVEGDGEHWAVKQIEIDTGGRVRRYWWKHPHDADGFLTDQALNPHDHGLAEVTRDSFHDVWGTTRCACGSPPD